MANGNFLFIAHHCILMLLKFLTVVHIIRSPLGKKKMKKMCALSSTVSHGYRYCRVTSLTVLSWENPAPTFTYPPHPPHCKTGLLIWECPPEVLS